MAKDIKSELEDRVNDTPFLDESGKLKPIKYRPLSTESPWNTDTFVDGYTGYKGLMGANTTQAYSELILGDKDALSQYPASSVDTSRNALRAVSQRELIGFGRKHSKNLADTLNNNEPKTLLEFVLSVKHLVAEENTPYANAVQRINYSREILEKIKKDPKKYIDDLFEGQKDYTKAFYSGFEEQLLKQRQQLEVNRVRAELSKYGLPAFTSDLLSNTHTLADKQIAEYDTKRKKAQDELNSLGDSPSKDKVTSINNKLQEEMKVISEKYGRAAEIATDLNLGLQEMTYQSISAKKSEEEAKGKETEEKEVKERKKWKRRKGRN